jgi:hypothetical protein
MCVRHAEFVQDMFPGEVVDYLEECSEELPEGAKIVAFPRDPKPHEVDTPWVKEHWM